MSVGGKNRTNPIRPLCVFLSHVQNREVDDTEQERRAIESTIDADRYFVLWTFERAPASSEPAESTWLEGVRESDLLLLLLGSDVTDAVEREVGEAIRLGRPLLVFLRDSPSERSARAQTLLDKVRDRSTYKAFKSVGELQEALRATLAIELTRSYRRANEQCQIAGAAHPAWRPAAGGTADHDYESLAFVTARELDRERETRIRETLEHARSHLDAGRFSAALALYQELRTASALDRFPPLRVKVLNNYAIAARALFQKEKALEAIHEARALDPDSVIVRLNELGLLATFRPEGWRTVVAENSEFLDTLPAGLQILAVIAAEDGRHEEARVLAERAIDGDRRNDAARLTLSLAHKHNARYGAALRALHGVSESSAYIVVARAIAAECHYELAKRNPHADAILVDAKKAVEDVGAFARALGLDAEDWKEARVHAGTAAAGLSLLEANPAGALEALAALRADLPPITYHYDTGQAWAAAEDWDEAVAAFRAAYEIEPAYLDVAEWYAAALIERSASKRSSDDLASAESILREAVERGRRGLAARNLAEILIGSKRLAEAQVFGDALASEDPDNTEFLAIQLQVAKAQEDVARSVSLARRIFARDPLEPTAAAYLGGRAFEAQDYERAIAYCRNAVADRFCRCSEHIDAYCCLALSLKQTGKVADALEVGRAALLRYPKNARIQGLLNALVERV